MPDLEAYLDALCGYVPRASSLDSSDSVRIMQLVHVSIHKYQLALHQISFQLFGNVQRTNDHVRGNPVDDLCGRYRQDSTRGLSSWIDHKLDHYHSDHGESCIPSLQASLECKT